MLAKDPQLKHERGYKDKRSYVRNDGSEVLFGKDWKKRKAELWERCGGKCEFRIQPLLRCSTEAQDPHHRIKHWPRRDDRLSNLWALCRFHHKLFDKRKPRWTPKTKSA